ncbi:MAG: hypothetical protein Fur002_09690 [Anaerolineales bacterium]
MKQIQLLTFILILALSAACGAPAATPEPFIQTAVAQTVAAQNAAQAATPIVITATPEETQTALAFAPTITPNAALPTVTPALSSGGNACAKASLVSETIVDGTIMKPGEKFIKTWEIKNISPCTWDSAYRIVFWDGDVLGGAYYYNLPQVVPSGGTVPISLALTAPTTDGDYTSKWVLQTPDKVNFGVGDYSAPFYANVVVSSSATPGYAVTSVTYEMVRDPANGCPANITYTAYATVTVNGPLTFKYYWEQSDGHNINGEEVKMEAAGNIVLSNSWKLNMATTPGTRWMALAIGLLGKEGYEYTTYPRVEFTKLCGG